MPLGGPVRERSQLLAFMVIVVRCFISMEIMVIYNGNHGYRFCFILINGYILCFVPNINGYLFCFMLTM